MRFAEVSDPTIMLLPCYIRQGMSKMSCVGLCREAVCFGKWCIYKSRQSSCRITTSRVFHWWVITWFPKHGGDERKSKEISGCSTVCIGRTKFVKEISVEVKLPWPSKGQNWETNRDRSCKTSEKMFLMSQGEHLAKHYKSRSVNAIAQVMEPVTGEVCCWRSGSLEKKLHTEE